MSTRFLLFRPSKANKDGNGSFIKYDPSLITLWYDLVKYFLNDFNNFVDTHYIITSEHFFTAALGKSITQQDYGNFLQKYTSNVLNNQDYRRIKVVSIFNALVNVGYDPSETSFQTEDPANLKKLIQDNHNNWQNYLKNPTAKRDLYGYDSLGESIQDRVKNDLPKGQYVVDVAHIWNNLNNANAKIEQRLKTGCNSSDTNLKEYFDVTKIQQDRPYYYGGFPNCSLKDSANQQNAFFRICADYIIWDKATLDTSNPQNLPLIIQSDTLDPDALFSLFSQDDGAVVIDLNESAWPAIIDFYPNKIQDKKKYSIGQIIKNCPYLVFADSSWSNSPRLNGTEDPRYKNTVGGIYTA